MPTEQSPRPQKEAKLPCNAKDCWNCPQGFAINTTGLCEYCESFLEKNSQLPASH